MSLSDTSELNLLSLLFRNTTWAGMGDATGLVGATVPGSLFVALHTADPGEAGTQATSEATYTGYARVAVARSAGGWTVAGTAPTTVSNAAAVTFAACTAGANTVTFFSIGKASSGATEILVSGALTSSLAISSGITPAFAIGALTSSAD